MKTIILLFIVLGSVFAQDLATTRNYVAAGVDSGIFTTFGIRLGQNTSTYTNAHFVTGSGVVLSQGLAYTMFRANQFSMAAAVDAGVTSRAQFAMGAGFLPSYDISRWTKISGLSIVGRVQMQSIGGSYSPNIGIGVAKGF